MKYSIYSTNSGRFSIKNEITSEVIISNLILRGFNGSNEKASNLLEETISKIINEKENELNDELVKESFIKNYEEKFGHEVVEEELELSEDSIDSVDENQFSSVKDFIEEINEDQDYFKEKLLENSFDSFGSYGYGVNVKLRNLKSDLSFKDLLDKKIIKEDLYNKINDISILTGNKINHLSDLLELGIGKYWEEYLWEQINNYSENFFKEDEKIQEIIKKFNKCSVDHYFEGRSGGYLIIDLKVNDYDYLNEIEEFYSDLYDVETEEDEINFMSKIKESEDKEVYLKQDIKLISNYSNDLNSLNELSSRIKELKKYVEENYPAEMFELYLEDSSFIEDIEDKHKELIGDKKYLLDISEEINKYITNKDINNVNLTKRELIDNGEIDVLLTFSEFHYPYFGIGHKELIDFLYKQRFNKETNLDYNEKIYELVGGKEEFNKELDDIKSTILENFKDKFNVKSELLKITNLQKIFNYRYLLEFREEDLFKGKERLVKFFTRKREILDLLSEEFFEISKEELGIDLKEDYKNVSKMMNLSKSIKDVVSLINKLEVESYKILLRIESEYQRMVDNGVLLNYIFRKKGVLGEDSKKILDGLKEVNKTMNQIHVYYFDDKDLLSRTLFDRVF